MDTSRHAGETAVVTGAASGIGKATAIRLAREGAHVIACDVSESGLEEARREVGDTEAGFEVVRCDITAQADARLR